MTRIVFSCLLILAVMSWGAESPRLERSPPQRACPGEGLIFSNRETDLHALTYGAGHVWCGFCAGNNIAKVDPQTMASESIVMKGQRGLHALCFDGKDVWGAHASGHVTRIAAETHAVQTIRMGGFAYTCFFDGRDIWVGIYSEPGRILRVDRATLQYESFVIPAAPNWSVRALASDGKRIWAALNTVPAMVAVLSPATRDLQVLALGRANELKLATSITFDGKSIWVGLDTMPATLVKIDPVSFRQEVYPLHDGSSCCRALLVTKDHLWVGLYTEPAEIARIDRETQRCDVVALPPAHFNTRAFAGDGTNLWIGLQNVRFDPSSLYRLPMREPFPAMKTYRFAPTMTLTEPRLIREQPAAKADEAVLTPQDWYRVRRGEDQLAWGKMEKSEGLPRVVLSQRAAAEMAFLSANERSGVLERLREFCDGSAAVLSQPVSRGEPRRLIRSGELRVVFQINDADQHIYVSTIRKQIGRAFDPEVMGPRPPQQ